MSLARILKTMREEGSFPKIQLRRTIRSSGHGEMWFIFASNLHLKYSQHLNLSLLTLPPPLAPRFLWQIAHISRSGRFHLLLSSTPLQILALDHSFDSHRISFPFEDYRSLSSLSLSPSFLASNETFINSNHLSFYFQPIACMGKSVPSLLPDDLSLSWTNLVVLGMQRNLSNL
jgi:hypothetical protein